MPTASRDREITTYWLNISYPTLVVILFTKILVFSKTALLSLYPIFVCMPDLAGIGVISLRVYQDLYG